MPSAGRLAPKMEKKSGPERAESESSFASLKDIENSNAITNTPKHSGKTAPEGPGYSYLVFCVQRATSWPSRLLGALKSFLSHPSFYRFKERNGKEIRSAVTWHKFSCPCCWLIWHQIPRSPQERHRDNPVNYARISHQCARSNVTQDSPGITENSPSEKSEAPQRESTI